MTVVSQVVAKPRGVLLMERIGIIVHTTTRVALSQRKRPLRNIL